MNRDERDALVEVCAEALAASEVSSAFDPTLDHSSIAEDARDEYRARARAVLYAAGQYLRDDVNRRLVAGTLTDNGWIQGVLQTGEDLLRCTWKDAPATQQGAQQR